MRKASSDPRRCPIGAMHPTGADLSHGCGEMPARGPSELKSEATLQEDPRCGPVRLSKWRPRHPFPPWWNSHVASIVLSALGLRLEQHAGSGELLGALLRLAADAPCTAPPGCVKLHSMSKGFSSLPGLVMLAAGLDLHTISAQLLGLSPSKSRCCSGWLRSTVHSARIRGCMVRLCARTS